MLFLACAPSYTRAGALATPLAAGTESPIQDPRELIIALRGETPAAQKAGKAAIERADPVMIDKLLRYGRTPGQREIAQKAVAFMGSRAVPALLKSLEDPSIAPAAGSVLFRVLEPRDADRIPALLSCANNVPAAKNYCIQSLVKVAGPKAAAHVPALAEALKSEDPLFRAFAAVALGAVGKAAAPAAPALRAALKDSEPEVRAKAKAALRRIGA